MHVGRDNDFALWTRKIVRDVIRQSFGADMTLQGVGKLLRRLGLSPQRPLYRAWQRNEEAVRRWKADEFPAIRDKARRIGADLYFCDEASVRTDHHSGTTWGPVGATPVVVGTGKRESVTMISAITPRGEICFDVFDGTFDSASQSFRRGPSRGTATRVGRGRPRSSTGSPRSHLPASTSVYPPRLTLRRRSNSGLNGGPNVRT